MPTNSRGPELVKRFSTITDSRGSLTVLEAGRGISFPIQRVYWLHGITSSESRGHHAHHTCRQAMVVVHGGCTLEMNDGRNRWSHRMERPDEAVLIEPLIWHSMSDFLPGTVCLVFASHPYDEADYIRDYDDFLRVVKGIEQ